MDTLLLSRIQFAANISFHILFPTINIALCWFLVYFRLRNRRAQGTPEARGWALRVSWRNPKAPARPGARTLDRLATRAWTCTSIRGRNC